MKIEDMRVDNLNRPMGLTSMIPVFSYRLQAEQTDDAGEHYQSAYRLLAASSGQQLEEDEGDLWDSGVVEAREPYGIVYGGKNPEARQILYWKVKVWDEKGADLGWSRTEQWEMGIFPEDWRGSWIGQGDAYEGDKSAAPMFVKDFTADITGMHYARLYISGLGLCVVSVNGKRLSDTLFDPGECDASETVYYVTYDVTQYLKQGENTVGVVLGNGQYTNFEYNPVMALPEGTLLPQHRYQKNDGGFVKPGIAGDKKLIAQLEIVCEGEKRFLPLVSDDTWLWSEGPCIFQNWYGGEDYDAVKEQEGWDCPGGSRSGWSRASVMKAPDGRLTGRDFPPIRIVEKLSPKEVRRLANGNWLVDMGRNGAGFPELRLTDTTLQRGCWVKMYPAELLREDGEGVDQASCTQSWSRQYQCAIIDSYRIRGSGTEIWHPQFSYQGFQYVEVEGYPGELSLENFRYCIVRTDNEKTGSIRTSHEILNQISGMVERSMESNMFGSFTDCPQIEKLGWIETSHLMFASLAGTYDIRAWMNKILRDIIDAQVDAQQAQVPGNEPEGYVPGIIPEYQRIVGLHRDPNWNGACIFTPWEYYQYYGDREVLRRAYPEMKAYLEYLWKYVKDDILEDYAQMGEWGEFGEKTPAVLVATCSYYRMLEIMGEIAGLLGEEWFAGQMKERAERTRKAFHEHPECYHPATQEYGNGSQASYGCVLFSNLVPQERKKGTVEKLVKAVERCGYHLSSGEVGLKQVFWALSGNGRNDVVYRMVMNETSPSYRYFVDAGYSTLPEYWNPDELWYGMARSRNHAMMGHVKEWMISGLLGVRPVCPGFGKISIQPWLPEGVEWMEGCVPTPHGSVKVRFWRENEGEKVKRKVEVPPGVQII